MNAHLIGSNHAGFYSFNDFDNGSLSPVNLDCVAVLEDLGGVDGADDAGEAVLTCHNSAVGDQPTQLCHDPAQQREVRAPTDISAHSDQNVVLKEKRERDFRTIF